MYDYLYDENNHKYLVFSQKADRIMKRPKGIYERLLCIDCEKHINTWENYCRDIFRDNNFKTSEIPNWLIMSGIDYAKFKLFLMSLIWRSSITTREDFSKVNLGPHSEIIRKMLLNNDPGEIYQYGVMTILPSLSKELSNQMIMPPVKLTKKVLGTHTGYFSIFCGLFWVFIVSKQSKSIPHKDFIFLSKDGKLPILVNNELSEKIINNIRISYQKAALLNMDL